MPPTVEEEDTQNQTQTNFFDQQVNGGSGESGDFFKKKNEKEKQAEDYEKIQKEEENQGLMSNFELLGDDATLTEMGGIFGSYAAQPENLEIETKHYEDKMRELRAKNQIKLNIDMSMNKNKLEESEFLASEDYNHKSSRESKQNTDRSETLAMMKKEMEQAKKIIEKFQHSTKKDQLKNRRDSAKNKRPSSKLSVKKSQMQK